jgi:DASH complex subunit SPC19
MGKSGFNRGLSTAGSFGKGGNAEKLRQLRQKKERLEYAVERLSLQAQQKERQLRMSIAAQ